MPDAAILARIQFAFTVSFHIIFPTISIGLAFFLAVFEGLWLKTKDPVYLQIYKFWLNIFAMAFGVGVVTGIVLSFEFGLGFAKFAKLAGPTRWFQIALVCMTPSGILATLGGWYTAEIGRQPYVIYGLLRTVDAVSPVPAGTLLTSLIAFVVIYSIFFTAFLFFVIRAIRRGPGELAGVPAPGGSLKRALRPQITASLFGEKRISK